MKWGADSKTAENFSRIGSCLMSALRNASIRNADIPVGKLLALFALFAATGSAAAAVRYVSPVSPAPAPPYTTWTSAARNIQDAVDAAGPGDTILVTNGVYATGGRAFITSLTNRVTINKPLVVQSVNGPLVTVIQGNQPIGSNAVRCVYLTNNATLIGFTLANGGTHTNGTFSEQNGGGAWCERSNAVISRCIFTNNTANGQGGGAFNGTLNNCLLLGNAASRGGAAAVQDGVAAILNNCTIVGNIASNSGGGLYSSGIAGASYLLARNCIVTDNSAPAGPNYAFGSLRELTMDRCCTTPLPPGGSVNFTNPPLFVNAAAGNFHLQTNSPCINAANNAYQTSSVDLDGNPRFVSGFVDIGAYEYQSAAPVPLSLSAQASYTNVSTGTLVTFTGQIVGNADSTHWDFKDGTVVSNKLPTITHSWNAPGDYDVALWGYNVSYPSGISASVTIHVLEHPIHYVAQTGTNPIAPYLTWNTAATNIQDAVDAAYINGTVIVSNGTYSSGGRPILYSGLFLSNRVAVLKPITLQSVNGPSVTTIQGYQVPGTTNGDSAIRCVYLTSNASLIGFTLTGGATLPYNFSGQDAGRVQSGGGVYCEIAASVSNCIMTGDCAYSSGGGASGGTLFKCVLDGNCAYTGGGADSATLNSCIVSGNSATFGGGIADSTANNCLLTGNNAAYAGGGAYFGTLNNCTVVSNLALVSGGGAYSPNAILRNSIIYYNSAPDGTNYVGGLLYCCTTPLPQVCECVLWNFTNAPAFIDEASGNFRLQTNSPCINSGNNDYQTNSVDLDGNPRVVGGFVDIGAYEYQAAAPVPLIPSLQASYTGVATGVVVTFTGGIAGHPDSTRWDFKDGTVISNQLPTATHSWNAPGDYDVALWGYNASYPNGISASVTIHVLDHPIHYVAQSGTNPVPPFLTWESAATNIQDAVDAAYINGTVVVSNGTYSSGGQPILYGGVPQSNRVAVLKPITLQSMNGPSVTTIRGYQVPGTTNGNDSMRCIYLSNNASLIGFTLTGGATLAYVNGAGVYSDYGASVSNCVITGNCAYGGGGGASRGTLFNCVLIGNCSRYGGGAETATLNNCVVSGNSAAQGGGTASCTLNNCLLTGNTAAQIGGGAVDGILYNCTVVNNLALVSGGGAYGAALTNSIVYNNSAPEGTNYTLGTLPGRGLQYCCTTPRAAGSGNFTNAPIFIDEASSDFRLQTNSPCINAGNNSLAIGSVDLDGRPRIVGGTVDVGAYEFQGPGIGEFIAWLRQFGLPPDGSADALDPDGDGMNNWQEWIAGTVPTNAASVLKMLSPTKNASGLQLTWQSVTGKTYFLQRSTNIAVQPAFLTIQSNLPGQTNTTAFTDSGATNQTPYFYRVGVQ
jgi:hypothetical protein